jgi:hypothetical protein
VARVIRNPAFQSYFLAAVGANVKKVTDEITDDAIAGCPIDSGDLVETIHSYFPGKLHGVVVVGTDHWPATEYGSEPHLIISHGPWSLHNAETDEYFGRVVHHPGTPAQPFMRPALYRKRHLVTVG